MLHAQGFIYAFRGLIHTAAGLCHCRSRRRVSLGVGDIGYQGFRGQHHRCNGSRVLQSGTGNLCGVENAGFKHIDIFFACEIEAVAGFVRVENLVDNNGAFKTRVLRNLANRRFNGFEYNANTGL